MSPNKSTRRFILRNAEEIANDVLDYGSKSHAVERFGITFAAVDSALWETGHRKMVAQSYVARRRKWDKQPHKQSKIQEVWENIIGSDKAGEYVLEGLSLLFDKLGKANKEIAALELEIKELEVNNRSLKKTVEETTVKLNCANRIKQNLLLEKCKNALATSGD